MRTVLTDLLASEGHRVIAASQGADGLERALAEQPDLILLDVMMPRLDGFALAQELRRLGRAVPILMLTAKGRVEDRVRGLDSGADDYLVKPFSGDELLARVRALLRRFHRGAAAPTQLQLGNVAVDFARLEVRRGGRLLHLTAKEFGLLRLLAETPGEPVSRERCLDVVWGVGAFPTTRTVDTHIASLRAKLEPGSPVDGVARFFKTVHGVGYRLDLGPDSATNPESGSVSVPGPGSDPELEAAPRRPEADPISQVDAASRPGKGRKP
jgi:DNA-binding response OmpR family regulator